MSFKGNAMSDLYLLFNPHSHPNCFYEGPPVVMDPHLSQEHAGLHHRASQP